MKQPPQLLIQLFDVTDPDGIFDVSSKLMVGSEGEYDLFQFEILARFNHDYLGQHDVLLAQPEGSPHPILYLLAYDHLAGRTEMQYRWFFDGRMPYVEIALHVAKWRRSVG